MVRERGGALLIGEQLDERRALIARAPDLQALAARLVRRGQRVVERAPRIPDRKGLLTTDGGICPDDGSQLLFDPWSPHDHRCGRCGKSFRGDRHDGRWAWLAHLWMAERIAELAATGIVGGEDSLCAWAASTITEYGHRYLTYPNADNVLGPSRLFFSTYLDSIWLTNFIAGAHLLREAGALDEEGIAAADTVAEEAANLIGEFDEGLSNRQTWHNAALAAAAVWFEDGDLAQRAVEGPRGLVGHLVDGFRPDGMWYEGENYHLFALRGLLTGAAWARIAGVEFFEEEQSRDRLAAALRAPVLSALPDGTFPARKDARFGVSLAQPMYLELWEVGVSGLVGAHQPKVAEELGDWLHHLYGLAPAPPAEIFDSYLHEAGEELPSRRGRSDLSWWMLVGMGPELPGKSDHWKPASVLLPEQGLAILRQGDRYASLECGEYGGGHGHPDRLHLTLHARGVHWLADPGTGRYVSRDLFWYRSTLAHNAPRVDGVSQPMADARAEMFDERGGWGWVKGRVQGLSRIVVAGPTHLVDVLEFADDLEHQVELPWHPAGAWELLTPGRWQPAEVEDEFAHGAERFLPDGPGPVTWRSESGGRTLHGVFDEGGELIRAWGPGRPGEPGERSFLIRRQRGRYVRFAAVVGFDGPAITGVRFAPGETVVETVAGPVIHRQTSEGWEVAEGGTHTALHGARRELLARIDLPVVGAELTKYVPPEVMAFHLAEPPRLDGTLAGFVTDNPIHLDHEDQYRRTEEPYPGPDAFSATAWLGWDETALYLAVAVTKAEPIFRPADAAPLRLDNEPDLIHSDGLQVYIQVDGQPRAGWLVVPDPAGNELRFRPISGAQATTSGLRGAWRTTEDGYRVTMAIAAPGWPPGANDDSPRFDLVVNEMGPGRARRRGQLVWTGGGGWAYVRGDRQETERAGRVLLA